MKIAFLNLPIPEPFQKYQRGNHQLFTDYIDCIAKLNNIYDIEIIKLSRDIIDRYNNQAIVNEIINQSIDIVGFSSYIWNTERNQQISMKLKKKSVITITGGPEIHEDNQNLINSEIFDYYIKGEGEYIVFDILKNIKEGKKQKDKIITNKKCVDFNDFIYKYSQITQQYLFDRLFYLEIERGCPYKCDYCSYGKFRDKITTIDKDLYKQILVDLFNKDIEEIYLLAPTLNRDKKRFKIYLDNLRILNNKFKKKIKIFGEIRAEFVDINNIKLMSLAGFKEIEFGIQALSQEILKSINRNIDLMELVKFCEKLIAYNITPMIDFIIGLPGDSYDNIINSIEALDKNKLLNYCNFYHLQVLPGTGFRKKFIAKNYKFNKKPPYFVISTDRLDISQIKNIYLYLENSKDISYREDLVIENEEQFYLIKNREDLSALGQTKFYQTASLIILDNFNNKDILMFFNDFFKENPEIFHKAYIYSKKRINFDFLNSFKKIFLRYKNYYDNYKESINYFNDDFFSKSFEILLSPLTGKKYLNSLINDYLINFIIFPLEINSFNSKSKVLLSFFEDYSLNTYLFKENNSIKYNFIKYFPIYFNRK